MATIRTGELAATGDPQADNGRGDAARRSLLEAQAAFGKHRGAARAAAVVTAGLAAGGSAGDPQLAESVRYLSRHSDRELQKALASSHRGEGDRVSATGEWRVGALRRLLVHEPRNALRWMDLALEYVKRGDMKRAARACETATALARDSRFILRSAARFWQHAGEVGKARHVVDSADATSSDPWLLATSVALADFEERSSPFLKIARNMLELQEVDPWHLSELAGAMATMEWRLGSDRQARRHMRQALNKPTENALAQAVWAQERGFFHDTESVEPAVPYHFEAAARQLAFELRWKEATDDADDWLQDQPFSTEAALFGSWTSAQAEDYSRAADFCNRGRIANPRNVWLANNLAYALAKGDRPDDAQRWVTKGFSLQPDSRQRAYLTATQGLVLFRLGHSENGRQHYEQAISHLVGQHRREEATVAKLILAEEEILAGTELAVSAYARAEGAVKETSAHFVRARWTRLRELVDQRPLLR